jgi:hypothetical protein
MDKLRDEKLSIVKIIGTRYAFVVCCTDLTGIGADMRRARHTYG